MSNIKRIGIFSFAILLLSFCSMQTQLSSLGSTTHTNSNLSPNIPDGALVVPDKYPNIQSAIGNASAGDTVFVKKGEYYLPPISINESLTLVGEGAQYTIINGGNPKRGTNLVTLQIGAPDVTISGFTIINCLTALLVENRAMQSFPSRCKLIGNIITNNSIGLSVHRSDNFLIQYNTVTANDIGIRIYSTDETSGTIFGNQINENALGISLYSTNITVKGNTIARNQIGLNLAWTGPYDIFNNKITNNTKMGIQFGPGVTRTLVFDNEISINGVGIELENFPVVGDAIIGSGNIVYNNNLASNLQNSLIKHSTVYTDGLNGTDIVSWDNGTFGNYWSDYKSKYPNNTQIDNTGVGNIPYLIDDNNIDHYPLIHGVNINDEESIFPAPIAPLITIALIVVVIVIILVLSFLIYIRYRAKKK